LFKVKLALVSALREIVKIILAGENEGRRILEDANDQAERIEREAQEKAAETYKKTYDETVAKGERRSTELKKKARENAEREAENILHRAEEEIKEIQAKARKNFDEAVNAILGEITS